MTSYTEIKNDIDSLLQQVTSANSVVRSGDVPDVTDLPKVTDFICQEIDKLSKSDRSKLSPKLLALIEELDNLTINIGTSLEKVKFVMKETTSHNKAARAYTTANIPGKK